MTDGQSGGDRLQASGQEKAPSFAQAQASAPSLDWRRWVPPGVRHEIHSFMWKSFGVGLLLAVIGTLIYARYSESRDKVFHCAILIGALGFTMPTLATSLKLMLTMFYMTFWAMDKNEAMARDVKEFKDEARPIMENVNKVASTFAEMTKSAGPDDAVKRGVEQMRLEVEKEGGFFQKLALRAGTFMDKAEKALEALAPPPAPRKPGLLERGLNSGRDVGGNGHPEKEAVPPSGGARA